MAELRSILSIDFGSVHTRVVLIDAVEGEYRLVSSVQGRTSDGFPVYNLQVGMMRLLRQMRDMTGRRLVDDTGAVITPEQADRTGVDLLALTASAGRPLRAVVVGLVPDVSIASAIRAAKSTYIDVRAVISLDDGRDEEERLNAILLNYPDVILLAGGTEAGAERAVLRSAELVRLAISLMNTRPSVIYSGNSVLNDRITDVFGDLTTVFVSSNVRPSLEQEDLDAARMQLGRAFDRYSEGRGHKFAEIGQMSRTGVMPSAQGHALVADYLNETMTGNVAVLDVGSASMTLALALEGEVTNSIRTDIGQGHSAPGLIESVGMDALRAWLPMVIDDNELRNYLMNKSLRPASIPETLRELFIEHAMLRAGVRQAIADLKPAWASSPLPLKRIIAGGAALTRTGNPGHNAMLVLDCLQPSGVTTLELDPFALIPATGALVSHVPEAVVQLLDGGNLTRLGVAINVSGTPEFDKPALKVKIEPEDENDPIVEDVVPGGHIWVYPLGYGERAKVTIRCVRGMTVGGKRRLTLTVEGGSLGIVFDARGRPLPLGDSVRERAAQLPLWVHEATGDELRDVDPEWLVEPEVAPEPETAPKEEKRRRGRRRKKDEAQEDAAEDRLGLIDEDADEEEDELGALRDVLS